MSEIYCPVCGDHLLTARDLSQACRNPKCVHASGLGHVRDERHKTRYARLVRGELTLREAVAEHDADWRASRDDGIQVNVVDIMRGGRVIAEGVPVYEVARKGPR